MTSLRVCATEVANTDLNLEETFSIHAGIAHTRWATHGEPSSRNSHPQTSVERSATLPKMSSHQGLFVVESSLSVRVLMQVLKETLLRQRFTFESETDTEVIPKLAKFVFDKANEDGDQTATFSEVVIEVMRHLEGAYALIFKSQHYPNELVACKRGSPLLLGVKVRVIISSFPLILFFSDLLLHSTSPGLKKPCKESTPPEG
ncbi:unnamed protein product [Thlaspi arvense]|uniref:glutamine--fructose-6-phosphate transaminase (isomerizing) n=1 Tax=Thlaspi arvense TaxID=13288 RepID=A0AAU9TC07_THLAR|nr:unnamed protein product [Thlaspi arvense]